MKRILLIFTTVTVLFGCSTDVDINAPYKDITIVYGILNMKDSVHFVKINKAFLGEGDALTYAQIQDSSEYRPEEMTHAMVYKILNNNRVDSFPLLDSLVENREPGLFYGPVQKVYYFTEHQTYPLPFSLNEVVYLDQDAEYEIDLTVKGQNITSRTTVTNDFTVQGAIQLLTTEIGFRNSLGTDYEPFVVKWNSGKDGKRYSLQWRFNYDEIRNGVTEAKAVTRTMPRVISTNSTTSGQQLEVTIDGLAFYNAIANDVPVDPTVERREFTGLDLIWTVANEDFNTFLSLSEPVSGIVEDRPSWTNMNNGFGIWASRYTKKIGEYTIGKPLKPLSLKELVEGSITGNRGFCNGVNDQGTSYDCP